MFRRFASKAPLSICLKHSPMTNDLLSSETRPFEHALGQRNVFCCALQTIVARCGGLQVKVSALHTAPGQTPARKLRRFICKLCNARRLRRFYQQTSQCSQVAEVYQQTSQ